MSVRRTTLFDEISPFFGKPSDDVAKKSKLFVSLNYPGENFNVAPNEGDVDSLKRKPIWQLMLAKNHEGDGTEENQISQAFIKFIKDVATHHKMLLTDKGANQGLKYVYDDLSSDAQRFFDCFLLGVGNTYQTMNLSKGVNGAIFKTTNVLDSTGTKTNITNFAATLPLLPAGCTTDGATMVPADFLRTTYATELGDVNTVEKVKALAGGSKKQTGGTAYQGWDL